MKKNILPLTGLVVWICLLISSCSSKKESSPCDNKGTLCILNKLDTEVIVTLNPIHDQFKLGKDITKCSQLDGNKPYTITFTSPTHENDTIIMILPCDNKLLIIK